MTGESTAVDPGFTIVPSVFRAADFCSIDTALAAATRGRAGMRHLMHIPAVQALASDPRLLALAAAFVGGAAVPFKATLFDKSRDANWLVTWHQDIALPLRAQVDAEGWGPWSRKAGQLYAHAPADALSRVVALRVHLDDSTTANGPLRVLPHSHRSGRLTESQIRRLTQEIDPVECVVDCGGVVAMRPLVVHSSSKSSGPRPRGVLHIEYANGTQLGCGLELGVA